MTPPELTTLVGKIRRSLLCMDLYGVKETFSNFRLWWDVLVNHPPILPLPTILPSGRKFRETFKKCEKVKMPIYMRLQDNYMAITGIDTFPHFIRFFRLYGPFIQRYGIYDIQESAK